MSEAIQPPAFLHAAPQASLHLTESHPQWLKQISPRINKNPSYKHPAKPRLYRVYFITITEARDEDTLVR